MSTLFAKRRRLRGFAIAAFGIALFPAAPAFAQQQAATPSDTAAMKGMDHSQHTDAAAVEPAAQSQDANAAAAPADHSGHADSSMAGMDMSAGSGASAPMAMGSMQGGKAPADARDPDAYADGYANSTLPGFEKADQISIGTMLVDELEFVSGNEGDGVAWSARISNGGDSDKLWLRSQGLKISGERLDPETSAEALWWHATGPFWGRTIGVRQDIGPGAHTWLAAGIEGLAPYWFNVELTAYLGDDGRLAARAKASYDMLLTNRLILTPQIEANLYSSKNRERRLGSGLSNGELGLRMRYEITRKLAPYVGYVWERSFGGTADFKRTRVEPISEHRFVVGLRLWW